MSFAREVRPFAFFAGVLAVFGAAFAAFFAVFFATFFAGLFAAFFAAFRAGFFAVFLADFVERVPLAFPAGERPDFPELDFLATSTILSDTDPQAEGVSAPEARTTLRNRGV